MSIHVRHAVCNYIITEKKQLRKHLNGLHVELSFNSGEKTKRLFSVLGKNLEPPLISLCFASEKPHCLVIFQSSLEQPLLL